MYGNEKAEISANTQAVVLLPDGANLIAADNTENTVNLNSTMTNEYAFAVESKGTLAISGKGTVNVNAKKASDESAVRVYGISTSGKLSVSDLILNVFGQDRAIYKGKSSTDNIEISGGTINAKCNTTDGDVTVEDNGKYAIHAEKGDIVISNGTVNANGGAIGIIASNGKVAVSDGTVTVDSGTQGLYATTSVDITGGTVKATAHGYVESTTGKGAKAIYSQGTIGISGTANVSATCINDKDVTAEGAKFYGIRSKNNITISGANAVITAKGTTAAFNINDGTSDKDLISDIDLVGYTNVGATEGKTTLTPAARTGIINLNGDTYKCVRTKETGPTPTPTPSPTPATKYTVTFDNQGHGVVPQSQKIENGGKISDPGSLTAEGYIFGGWYTDKACTTAWDFDNDTVTQNMTLYAKWTEKTKEKIDISTYQLILSSKKFAFANKTLKPEVTVQGEDVLTEGVDYTVENPGGKKVGTYTVTVTGIGDYTGTMSDSYIINPPAKSIKTVYAGKKKLTVKWKKSKKAYTAARTGFQIRYSTSKSFKKYKTRKVGRKATSKTIKGLKSHKKYYVKMRAYKKVKTSAGTRTYYSKWSKAKVRKTK